MKKYSRKQLVFIDESAKDDRTQHRRFGYFLSGTRVEKSCIYIWSRHYILEAALGSSGIIAHKIKEGADIISFLADTNIFPSKGEARKMLQNGGVSLNRKKVENIQMMVNDSLLLHNKYLLAQKRRKNYYLIIAE